MIHVLNPFTDPSANTPLMWLADVVCGPLFQSNMLYPNAVMNHWRLNTRQEQQLSKVFAAKWFCSSVFTCHRDSVQRIWKKADGSRWPMSPDGDRCAVAANTDGPATTGVSLA